MAFFCGAASIPVAVLVDDPAILGSSFKFGGIIGAVRCYQVLADEAYDGNWIKRTAR
jgi:hypothetical protein